MKPFLLLSIAHLFMAQLLFAQTDKPVNLVGHLFPNLKGTALSGKEVVFPKATEGEVAIITIGFVQKAQHKIDTWIKPLEPFITASKGTVYYEVPLMKDHNPLIRWMANNGMRSGIPKAKHPYVVCYFGDQKPYFKVLGAKDENDAFLLVVDRKGVVRYQKEGYASSTDIGEVKKVITGLLAEPIL
jgi:hypothetical protein